MHVMHIAKAHIHWRTRGGTRPSHRIYACSVCCTSLRFSENEREKNLKSRQTPNKEEGRGGRERSTKLVKSFISQGEKKRERHTENEKMLKRRADSYDSYDSYLLGWVCAATLWKTPPSCRHLTSEVPLSVSPSLSRFDGR